VLQAADLLDSFFRTKFLEQHLQVICVSSGCQLTKGAAWESTTNGGTWGTIHALNTIQEWEWKN